MKHCTVIDIGSSKISCISAGTSGDGALVIHGAEQRPYPGYRLGRLPAVGPLSEALYNALSDLQEDTGLRIKNVTVGVPAPFVKTAVTTDEVRIAQRPGRITEADIALLIARGSDPEFSEEWELMHSTPFDYTVDGTTCDGSPVGLPADRLSASFCHAFLDRDLGDLVSGALDSMGVSVGSFVSTGMACASFTIPFAERMKGAVLIDCGGTHCDVSAIRGNALIRTECVGIGGSHFTNDVALALRLPLSVAEDLKRRYVFGLDYGESSQLVRIPNEGVFEIGNSTLQMIIEARAEELAGELCSCLDSVEAELPSRGPVYLVGGGIAPMRGGAEFLSAKTGREIRVNVPKTSRMGSASSAPALSLAQFMLYGGAQTGIRQASGGRVFGNIKEFFTAGNKR